MPKPPKQNVVRAACLACAAAARLNHSRKKGEAAVGQPPPPPLLQAAAPGSDQNSHVGFSQPGCPEMCRDGDGTAESATGARVDGEPVGPGDVFPELEGGVVPGRHRRQQGGEQVHVCWGQDVACGAGVLAVVGHLAGAGRAARPANVHHLAH